MEPLSDPLNDRVVKNSTIPPHRPLDHNLLFPDKSKIPDTKILREHLKKEGKLHKSDLIQIIESASSIFRSEPNLLWLRDPIIIVGDIHGQFYDLLKMFEIGGSPKVTKYLFLGDYVDRGVFSTEVIILLYSLKVRYPDKIYMLRGNHESRNMTSYFNFRSECITKYDLDAYDRIMESFDLLPLSSLINEKFIALHGGISPRLAAIEDIGDINRFREPPKDGIFCDILWSDPINDDYGRLSSQFQPNQARGCSFVFGHEAVTKFLDRTDLISIIRGHEAQLDGFKMHRWNGSNEFPSVITVFSAPNYCDTYNNKAAIIKLDDDVINIQQFNFTNHPFMLPNFMNVFAWSVPFLVEKVMAIFMALLEKKSVNGKAEADEQYEKRCEELEKQIREKHKAILKDKVKSIGKMMKLYKKVREEHEFLLDSQATIFSGQMSKHVFFEDNLAFECDEENFMKAKAVDESLEKSFNSYI
ncbi:unnamed protein product [Blepharisma stoltei]|uniref:Serine/threonine-protein phosphatase n=1 Tax=Blepharisma stoltei TaxID=1481888 RepID=A0AAU9JTM2_9CILI|nr:unnamed protein product [Blepharisma stoltei]